MTYFTNSYGFPGGSGGGYVWRKTDVYGSVGELMRLDASGNITANTGNLVIGTSGKGIDFSATASGSGTMTSELLADYEEGTWTPTLVPKSGTITGQTRYGNYVKIGQVVHVQFFVYITNVGTGAGFGSLSGLPYASANISTQGVGVARESYATGTTWTLTVDSNASTLQAYTYNNGDTIATGYAWSGCVSYIAA